MKTPSSLRHTALTLFVIVVLSACSGSDNNTGRGLLTLRISDAPVDTAEHVYIQFHGIEIHSASGTLTSLHYCQDPTDANKTVASSDVCTSSPAAKQIDLLALSGEQTVALLDGFSMPSAHYNWIRLMVDTGGIQDSYIVVAGGGEHELTIPSGSESGLKLNRGFEIPAGGSADFTIDFNLRNSVHVNGMGAYMLRPSLRLLDNTLVGTIAGTVNPLLVPAGCTPAVYIYSGAGATPDDIDGIAPDPVTSATVQLHADSGEYRYIASFLEAGEYTLAYTCQAAADDPVVDDAISFTSAATVLVIANTITQHNL